MPASAIASVISWSSAVQVAILLAKVTVLLAAASGLTALFRRAPATARCQMWLAALVGVLLLPALMRWSPIHLGILPSGVSSVTGSFQAAMTADVPPPLASAVPTTRSPAPAASAQTLPVPVSGSVGVAPGDAASAPLLDRAAILALAIWALVAASLLGWLIVGTVLIRRITRSARSLDTPDWTVPLFEAADRMGLERAPRLLISSRVDTPFASGLRRPAIVLPEAAEAWSEERRRLVLMHELAHIQRRDLAAHALSRLTCALYWFHPLVWTAAKRLRSESERACDDTVVAMGVRASSYANHLLEIVSGARHRAAPVMALSMARRSEFEGRMLALLDASPRRSGVSRVPPLATAVGFGVLACVLAAAAPATPRPGVVRGDGATTPATPVATKTADPSSVRRWPSHSSATESPDRQAEVQLEPQAEAHNAQRPAVSPESAGTNRVELLIRALESDSSADVRRVAAWALNEAPQSTAVTEALAGALRGDTNDRVREMSAWALAERSTGGATGALMDALRRDRDEAVRETAAWALGERHDGGSEGTSALSAALRDSSADVRGTAAWALGELRPDQAPPALSDALDDQEAAVRTRAAWALGQIGDSAAAGPLERAFGRERDPESTRAELWALARIGSYSESVLQRALSSKDPELRRQAVISLGSRRGSAWPWPWPQPRPRPRE